MKLSIERNGYQPRILLGGVGGDSHSVGLTILRHSLQMKGYHVSYLGTQNRLEDFFQLAGLCSAVLISSMDGHTRYYLREFPELMKKYQARTTLWYLGGNLHMGNGIGYERYFVEMGFDRVFVKFTDVRTVLAVLEKDLARVERQPDCPTLVSLTLQTPAAPWPVSDEQLARTTFLAERAEVLEQWRTGPEARDMEANAQFLLRQPSFPKAQAEVNAGLRSVLIQPRSGVPLVCEQIEFFKTFKECGARVLSYQVDSLTRNNDYAGAEQAVADSRKTKAATLNGFPVVNHGVRALRRVISEVGVPLQTRHSTRDPRLLAEISYAGGVTAFEGGAICYNIPYYKDYPLEESIRRWQYVDRLTGLYHEQYGVVLDREFFGTLTATLIPPSLAVAVNLLECVLALGQGVKCLSLGYAEQGNRAQDIAAVRVMGEMARELCRNLGYADVQINTVFHQYMAAFPEDRRRAESLIYNSAVTAALSGATRLITKTHVEACRIPALEDNVWALDLVLTGVAAAARERVPEARVSAECDLIRREARAIFDSVVECGRGSIARGIVRAFREGFIDVPFAPSIFNRGEVLTARDADGAVRYLSFGNLPFDRELKEFNREAMSRRRRAEGFTSKREDYLLVEKDVMCVPRGEYECWPLSA